MCHQIQHGGEETVIYKEIRKYSPSSPVISPRSNLLKWGISTSESLCVVIIKHVCLWITMKRAEVRVVAVEGDCDLLSGCHIYNNKITSLPQHPKLFFFFRKPAILSFQLLCSGLQSRHPSIYWTRLVSFHTQRQDIQRKYAHLIFGWRQSLSKVTCKRRWQQSRHTRIITWHQFHSLPRTGHVIPRSSLDIWDCICPHRPQCYWC